jgi:hypothetical protein
MGRFFGELAITLLALIWVLVIWALIIGFIYIALKRFLWFVTSSLPEKYRDGKIAPKMDSNYKYIDDEEPKERVPELRNAREQESTESHNTHKT